MPRETFLVASFRSPGTAAHAIHELRAAGCSGLRVIMPAPYESIEHALGRGPSPIGWATFIGALAGAAGGYGLSIGTSLAWPLIISGKPFASPIPYTVIAFECAVLVGAITNLCAVLIGASLARRHPVPYDKRFSGDRIGLYLPVLQGDDASRWFELLRREGAENVERRDA